VPGSTNRGLAVMTHTLIADIILLHIIVKVVCFVWMLFKFIFTVQTGATGPADLHPAAGRRIPHEHPEGQPAEVAGGEGRGRALPGQDDPRLLRRRPNRDLPARL